LKENKDLTLI